MLRRACLAVAGLAVAVSAAACGFDPLGAQAQPATYIGSYTWPPEAHGYGGFSGIELADDGTRLIVLSDRGAITRGRLLRDSTGLITGVEPEPVRALRGPDGDVLRRAASDSEGLARDGRGRLYISFEGVHRVLRYDQFGGPATVLPSHPDFAEFSLNKSLEALAATPEGTLYTMPEDTADAEGFPIYRFQNGEWDQPFHVSQTEGFQIAGADIGPDGRLYLLERNFRVIGGFASRVRRFDISGDQIGAGETVMQSGYARHDNLEGLSVWRDETGAIRLTMISDDNFFSLQRTEIVEYRLSP